MSSIDVTRKLANIKEITDRLEGLRDDLYQYVDPENAGIVMITGAGADAWAVNYTEILAALLSSRWLIGIRTELDDIDIYTIAIAAGLVGLEVDRVIKTVENEAPDTGARIHLPPTRFFVTERVSCRIKTVAGGNHTISDTTLEWADELPRP